jgi:hypothetical protein
MKQIKPKIPTSKQWHEKLDTKWAKAIKMRDGHKCKKCLSPDNLQSAHIYSRTFRSTRWTVLNGLTLCAKCHFWAHQEPIEFAGFVGKELGEYALSALRLAKNRPIQLNQMKFEEINASLDSSMVYYQQ